MGSLARTLALRAAQGFCVIGITVTLALGIPRWSHPELYPDEQGWSGLAHAMGRAFFHFDFGVACAWVGCPKVSDMWARGYAADVWMLFGTVAIGVGAGFALGVWCAARAGSRRARVVERGSVVLYCAPVYVVGLGVLLLFHPTFGTLQLPYFFDATPIQASLLSSPWDWFRSLLVPWLVAAAPLAAMCLRLVLAQVREQLDSYPVRTAIAKGVPYKRVVRRHAGPFATAATASLVGVSAPSVINLPGRAGLRRAGLLRAHLEGDRPFGGPLVGRLRARRSASDRPGDARRDPPAVCGGADRAAAARTPWRS